MYSENEGANLHLFLLPVNFLHTKKICVSIVDTHILYITSIYYFCVLRAFLAFAFFERSSITGVATNIDE